MIPRRAGPAVSGGGLFEQFPPVDGCAPPKPAAPAPAGFLPLVLACALVGGASPAGAAPLQVTVTGVRNPRGSVNICVYDTDKGFPDCGGNPAVTSLRQHAAPGDMRFDFDVAAGVHAVSVLHDENGNGRLDTGFLGAPLEGVGTSNDPPPRRGPPRFEDATFRLPPGGGHINVRLVYP